MDPVRGSGALCRTPRGAPHAPAHYIADMTPDGFRLIPGALAPDAQAALLSQVLAAAEAAPFVRSTTPWGKPMSVAMTSLGALGWTADRRGYRYSATHPQTGAPWPPIPAAMLDLWAAYAGPRTPPDSCLVNLYREGARMGPHQDTDEQNLRAPVLSVSLGDTALFRIDGAA